MIYQLEIFKKVYEIRNFSKASKELGLTQSAVSQQIKTLEEELGIRLFDATDRSIPTPAGDYLYREAGRLLSHLQDIKNSIGNLKQIIKGKIVFGMIDVAAINLMPKILKRFRNRYPDVEMEAQVKPSGELVKMVEDFKIDFCIAVEHDIAPFLESKVIYEDSIVAIVNKKSKYFRAKQINIPDLKGEPLILYPSASYSRILIEKFFKLANITPTVAMEMHYPSAIVSLVAQGMGIGLISELSARQERLHGLNVLRIAELERARKIMVVYRKDRSLSPQSQALIKMITEAKL